MTCYSTIGTMLTAPASQGVLHASVLTLLACSVIVHSASLTNTQTPVALGGLENDNPSVPTQSSEMDNYTITTDTSVTALAGDNDDNNHDKIILTDSQKTGLIVGVILLALLIMAATALGMFWRHRRHRYWQPPIQNSAENKQYKMMCYARRKDGPVFCEIDVGDSEDLGKDNIVVTTTDEQGTSTEQDKNTPVAKANGTVQIEDGASMVDGKHQLESKKQGKEAKAHDKKAVDTNANSLPAKVKRSNSSSSSSSSSSSDSNENPSDWMNPPQGDVVVTVAVANDNNSSDNSDKVSDTAGLTDTWEDNNENTNGAVEDRDSSGSEVNVEEAPEELEEVLEEPHEVEQDNDNWSSSPDSLPATEAPVSYLNVYEADELQMDDAADFVEPDAQDAGRESPCMDWCMAVNPADDPENGESIEPIQSLDAENFRTDLSDVDEEPDDPVSTRMDPDTGESPQVDHLDETSGPGVAQDPEMEDRIEQGDPSEHNDDIVEQDEDSSEQGKDPVEQGDYPTEQVEGDSERDEDYRGEGEDDSGEDGYEPREGEPE